MSWPRIRRSSGMRCGAAESTTASTDLAGCCGNSELSHSVGGSRRPQRNREEPTMQTRACRRAGRVGVAALALVVVGWQPAAAQEPIEFKAGISDPVNTVLAWYVARDAGFYAAQGLKVDIVNMSGGSRGAAELQAG